MKCKKKSVWIAMLCFISVFSNLLLFPAVDLFAAVKPQMINPGIYTTDKEGIVAIKLNEKNKTILLDKDYEAVKITVKTKGKDTSNLNLTISQKNLFNGTFQKGYLTEEETGIISASSNNYRTTNWIPISAAAKSLVLSGTAHNRSTWQFLTSDGKIISNTSTSKKYKDATDVMQEQTVSKVDIPENAVAARVYYAYMASDTGALLDNRLQIEYGKVATNYEAYQKKVVSIPDLKKGNYIIYQNKKWNMYVDKKAKPISVLSFDLASGTSITLNADAYGEVTLYLKAKTKTNNKDGIYGIRYKLSEANPFAERIEDAKNLNFTYQIGSSWASPYQNDFDTIYPWSEIRVCAVSYDKYGNRNIIYKGEEGFAMDGSAGNIMVEIPKFYVQRIVKQGYEYLKISGTEHSGFRIDPSFETEEGIIDHIYIGAYFSALDSTGESLESTSGSYPMIKRSLSSIRTLAKQTEGGEYRECDLAAIMTLQKLFLVETATLDSQSLFAGNVWLPYLLKDKSTSYYSLLTEKNTNRIIIKNEGAATRFRVGDSVSILDSWKEYQNTPDIYQRDILDINKLSGNRLEIIFSGNPVNIEKSMTGITCIADKNGSTNSLAYHTAAESEDSGHSSFKYRGIENLWGTLSIVLDGAVVKNSKLTVTYPNGEETQIGYDLPVQAKQLWPGPAGFGAPTKMCIKQLGYDKENPFIMLPSVIGNGASTGNYYADAWYNIGEKNIPYILTFGGAWDNKGYAGIFCLRATFQEKEAITYNGSRLILR